MQAELALANGSIQPGTGAAEIPFERAGMSLSYDQTTARLRLTELDVQSKSLRLRAAGHGDLMAADGGPLAPGDMPDHLLAQIAFSEVIVDPDGLFQEPVRFPAGALDLRLRLDPLRLDIGQLSLVDDNGDRMILVGALEAKPEGWAAALDVTLDRTDAGRLLKLWPVSAVPKTRNWFAENVGQANLTDVLAALRVTPGAPPRLNLAYEFAEAEVRVVRTLRAQCLPRAGGVAISSSEPRPRSRRWRGAEWRVARGAGAPRHHRGQLAGRRGEGAGARRIAWGEPDGARARP